MEWLFGKKKTPEEMLRENQRALRKAMRELEKERTSLEKQEQKIIIDLKKTAKAGQLESAKIMAKDLVRTRGYVKKMILMHTQIQAVSLKIQTLKSTNTMAQAMKGVAQAMGRMNAKMNIPALQGIMREFEMQSEMMDSKQEMMDDAIDGMNDVDDEEESENVFNQVMDELGLTLAGDMASVPQTKVGVGQKAVEKQPEAVGADLDLQARLDNLRRTDD